MGKKNRKKNKRQLQQQQQQRKQQQTKQADIIPTITSSIDSSFDNDEETTSPQNTQQQQLQEGGSESEPRLSALPSDDDIVTNNSHEDDPYDEHLITEIKTLETMDSTDLAEASSLLARSSSEDTQRITNTASATTTTTPTRFQPMLGSMAKIGGGGSSVFGGGGMRLGMMGMGGLPASDISKSDSVESFQTAEENRGDQDSFATAAGDDDVGSVGNLSSPASSMAKVTSPPQHSTTDGDHDYQEDTSVVHSKKQDDDEDCETKADVQVENDDALNLSSLTIQEEVIESEEENPSSQHLQTQNNIPIAISSNDQDQQQNTEDDEASSSKIAAVDVDKTDTTDQSTVDASSMLAPHEFHPSTVETRIANPPDTHSGDQQQVEEENSSTTLPLPDTTSRSQQENQQDNITARTSNIEETPENMNFSDPKQEGKKKVSQASINNNSEAGHPSSPDGEINSGDGASVSSTTQEEDPAAVLLMGPVDSSSTHVVDSIVEDSPVSRNQDSVTGTVLSSAETMVTTNLKDISPPELPGLQQQQEIMQAFVTTETIGNSSEPSPVTPNIDQSETLNSAPANDSAGSPPEEKVGSSVDDICGQELQPRISCDSTPEETALSETTKQNDEIYSGEASQEGKDQSSSKSSGGMDDDDTVKSLLQNPDNLSEVNSAEEKDRRVITAQTLDDQKDSMMAPESSDSDLKSSTGIVAKTVDDAPLVDDVLEEITGDDQMDSQELNMSLQSIYVDELKEKLERRRSQAVVVEDNQIENILEKVAEPNSSAGSQLDTAATEGQTHSSGAATTSDQAKSSEEPTDNKTVNRQLPTTKETASVDGVTEKHLHDDYTRSHDVDSHLSVVIPTSEDPCELGIKSSTTPKVTNKSQITVTPSPDCDGHITSSVEAKDEIENKPSNANAPETKQNVDTVAGKDFETKTSTGLNATDDAPENKEALSSSPTLSSTADETESLEQDDGLNSAAGVTEDAGNHVSYVSNETNGVGDGRSPKLPYDSTVSCLDATERGKNDRGLSFQKGMDESSHSENAILIQCASTDTQGVEAIQQGSTAFAKFQHSGTIGNMVNTTAEEVEGEGQAFETTLQEPQAILESTETPIMKKRSALIPGISTRIDCLQATTEIDYQTPVPVRPSGSNLQVEDENFLGSIGKLLSASNDSEGAKYLGPQSRSDNEVEASVKPQFLTGRRASIDYSVQSGKTIEFTSETEASTVDGRGVSAFSPITEDDLTTDSRVARYPYINSNEMAVSELDLPALDFPPEPPRVENAIISPITPKIPVAKSAKISSSPFSAPPRMTGRPPRFAFKKSRKVNRLTEIIRKDLWSEDRNLVESSLVELGKMAEANAPTIARSGGLLAIVQIMEQHIDHPGIQVSACHALEKLALDHENEVAISEVGGLEAVISSMMANFHDDRVHEAGWSALWNMTCHHADLAVDIEEGLQALTSCMAEHAQQPNVQRNACGTLANLCQSPDRMKALRDAGGFVAIATALENHWDNDEVRQEASNALTTLLEPLAETYDMHLFEYSPKQYPVEQKDATPRVDRPDAPDP